MSVDNAPADSPSKRSRRQRVPATTSQSLPRKRWTRREQFLLAAVVVLVVLVAVSVTLATRVKSPAERAAETAAPPRTLLTVPVARRVLTSTLVVRGTVAPSRTVAIMPTAAAGFVSVITAAPDGVGADVRAGSVAIAVSGRPVIVLPGVLPAYRDLGAGDTGPDVAQLQQALLATAGGTGADKSGTFGQGTSAALNRLYAHAGYAPAKIRGKTGLPLTEVAYVPGFPALVTQVAGNVGDTVKGSLITLASGTLHVTVNLDPDQSSLVRDGLAVALDAETLGESAAGKVSFVGPVTTPDDSGGDGSTSDSTATSGPYVPVQIDTTHPLLAAWAGQDVRVTISAARSQGPVLVVPSSAITSRADGSTVVDVLRNGTTHVVAVHVGGTGDGFDQVAPTEGELAPGDRVVVGQQASDQSLTTQDVGQP